MDFYVKQIGENKGRPRIFLDGAQAARAGFAPGDSFNINIEGERLTLKLCADGSRTVSGRIDKKTGQKTHPVIDLNSGELLKIFDGMDAVRMIVREGSIVFLPLASELAKKERLDRVVDRVANRETIRTGSLTHGVGILAHAIHQGLLKVGVNAEMAFVNEIREDLLDHAREHNSAWSENTIGVSAPMQEIVQDRWLMSQLPKLEILDMSLPCSGASKAGSTKLKLEKMEDHPHVGHLVFAALAIINHTQPAVILLENVKGYASSASAQILRRQLNDMGYDLHEAVVNGKDFGLLEARERWALVAVTKGMEFSFDQIVPTLTMVRTVGEVLDDVPLDSPRWSRNEGLKAKELRDIENGKGFRLPIVNAESTSVPTLRKHYQKRGSCDVQVAHPSDPELSRLFTGREHLRLKGIDAALFGSDASEALMHQAAGQAVQPPVFTPIGERIGKAVLTAKPYERAKRAILVDEVAKGLTEGIAYSPTKTVAEVVHQVTLDLFGEEPQPDESVPTNSRPRRKLGGGGVG